MLSKSRYVRIAFYFILIAFAMIFYLKFCDQQTLIQLAYDGPGCATTHESRKNVEDCLKSYGYELRQDRNQDFVYPDLKLHWWSLNSYLYEIDYGPNQEVISQHLTGLHFAF